MDYKKTSAPNDTVNRDPMSLCEETGNIYESVVIIGKRANQISAEIKQELSKKLSEFASTQDNLDEVFENREQIEISRYYEKLPKATLLATQEFIDGKIYYRNPSKEATLIAHFMTNESMETVDMYNLWLVSEGQHMFYFCPVMMGILVITSAFVFMDIWLYKHRALQMRMASLCMVLLVAWYIAYGIISYLLSAEMPATWRPHWTAALPAAALILLYLAFRGILKDEMLVRSLDRLR